MALRTFHSNPALGGFGSASSSFTESGGTNEVDVSAGGEAFAQIIKELVDNAIDACSTLTAIDNLTLFEKRVRVNIDPVNAQQDGIDDDDLTSTQELLRVTVTDNGSGMDDIQRCVNPFRSNKQQSNQCIGQGDEEALMDGQDNYKTGEHHTFGRYGIGLTLCLLHGQRLVSNSSSQITSATASSKHWTNTVWVVDTDDDTIKCVKQWHVAKTNIADSGTKVSLVLPAGNTAIRAWSRLQEYFNRFHLSNDLQCTLEVLAPSLSRVPVYIKPKVTTVNRDESLDSGSDNSTAAQIKALAAVNERLLAIRDSAQLYAARQIELKNIAHCQFPIRTDAVHSLQSDTPYLEVSLFVFSPDEEVTDGVDEDIAEQTGGSSVCSSRNDIEEVDKSCGEIRLIRMVNGIPLLDTVEVWGCGILNTIASLRQVWFSFGLDVALSHIRNDQPVSPTFYIRDCEQILPYLAKGSHEMFGGGGEEEESDDESTSSSNSAIDSDIDGDVIGRRSGRRRRANSIEVVLPARVRFANAIMVVHVHGTPSSLPLPTLSKGCLPADNKAIDDALELGLGQCLRTLQRSNPSLLFSASLLQSSERDARYVPLLATAVTSIIRNFESRSNNSLMQKLRSWKAEADTASDDSDQSSHLGDSEKDHDSEHEDGIGSAGPNLTMDDGHLVSFMEMQIRRRLQLAHASRNNQDEDDDATSNSDSSSNEEPATKKGYYQDLLNSSTEADSTAESGDDQRASDHSAGEAKDDDPDLDDWL